MAQIYFIFLLAVSLFLYLHLCFNEDRLLHHDNNISPTFMLNMYFSQPIKSLLWGDQPIITQCLCLHKPSQLGIGGASAPQKAANFGPPVPVRMV